MNRTTSYILGRSHFDVFLNTGKKPAKKKYKYPIDFWNGFYDAHTEHFLKLSRQQWGDINQQERNLKRLDKGE